MSIQKDLEDAFGLDIEDQTDSDYSITNSDKKNVAVLSIAKLQCLNCRWLCSDNQKAKEYDCMTLKNCPANHISIEVGVDIETIALSIAKARVEGDVKTYARRVSRLTKLSTRQAEACLSRVEELYKASKTI